VLGLWDFLLWSQCRVRCGSSLRTAGVTEMKRESGVCTVLSSQEPETAHCLLPAVQGGACIRSVATLIC
jgi:hypothetical protein